jgi:hypothetical protein
VAVVVPPSTDWEQRWNDFHKSYTTPLLSDEPRPAELLALTIRSASAEMPNGTHFGADPDGLGKQVEEVARKAGEIPAVVVRSTDYPKDPKAAVSREIAKLVAPRGKGRRVVVANSDWRAMAAFREFHARHHTEPGFADWQRADRPLAELRVVHTILALDKLLTAPPAAITPPAPPLPPAGLPKEVAPPKPAVVTPAVATAARVRLGVTRGQVPAAVELRPKDLCRQSRAPGSPVTVKAVQKLVADRDDALTTAVDGFEDKHYKKLAEDLLTLTHQHRRLLEGGDPLDVDTLLGRGEVAGKTRLTVINMQFLGDPVTTDFWVSQFLLAVDRWRAKNPAPDGVLQAVFLFDEADQYLPAVRQPASKGPMESLLKRARLAAAHKWPGPCDLVFPLKVRHTAIACGRTPPWEASNTESQRFLTISGSRRSWEGIRCNDFRSPATGRPGKRGRSTGRAATRSRRPGGTSSGSCSGPTSPGPRLRSRPPSGSPSSPPGPCCTAGTPTAGGPPCSPP